MGSCKMPLAEFSFAEIYGWALFRYQSDTSAMHQQCSGTELSARVFFFYKTLTAYETAPSCWAERENLSMGKYTVKYPGNLFSQLAKYYYCNFSGEFTK